MNTKQAEQTWSIESGDGTEIASGMTLERASEAAQDVANRTGKAVYVVCGAEHEEFSPA